MITPRLLVHHAVAERLDAATATCVGRPEEGGILLGAYREGGLEVTALTEAAPTDERSLLRFVRQDPRHQEAATAAWEASSGTITVVGEWHTHPSGEPQPSGTDLRTWKRVLRRSRYPRGFVIASPGGWRAWLGMRRWATVHLTRLYLIERGNVGVVLVPDAGER